MEQRRGTVRKGISPAQIRDILLQSFGLSALKARMMTLSGSPHTLHVDCVCIYMSKCVHRQTHTHTHADCDRLYRMLVFSFILQKLLDEIGHHVTVVRTSIPLTNIPSNFIFSRSLKCVLRVVKMCSTDRQSFLVDRGLLWIDPKIKSVPSVPSVARV